LACKRGSETKAFRSGPEVDDLPFLLFDADNHYYEAEDAFTRHIDPRMKKRCMNWATLNGRKELLVAGKVNRFIPNPTFDPVARPGCLDQYYRGNNPEGLSIRDAFGALEPIRPEYRDRDLRLKKMDEQGIEKAIYFPTLGVGMEEALKHDTEAVHTAFEAFNRWLLDDWGFAYQERIYAAPYLSLMDLDRAVRELEWAISNDARFVVMRPSFVYNKGGSRSPADPYFDPFWKIVNDEGLTVVYHGGDAGYGEYMDDWGEGGSVESFGYSPLRMVALPHKAPFDLMAALISHRLFDRFPNLRMASIEMGAFWVNWLLQSLERAYGQDPNHFAEDPVETFRRHVWIAPFHEDSLLDLKNLLGAENMLLGSDWPHAEGLAEPTEFVEELEGFSDAEIKRVMRDNALGLSRRRPV
jgi:predicted TIM-barrel fold metal-dependent hydrolase